jgi:hypothetical protein
MNKKLIFRQLITDFSESSMADIKPRTLDIPYDVPKIVSLLGPRRAGKTYFLFHIIKELRKSYTKDRLVYINFEDDRLFPLKLEDMEAMLQTYYEMYPQNRDQKVWFFFDEIQAVPNWEKFVRRLSDTENCRIYLTGSSSKLLSRELATSLRGRTLPYEVFPLSFSEFLYFNDIKFNPASSRGQATALHWFDRWLKQGGFPELVFLPENLHRRTIDEYIDLMLYRDLTERFSLKNPAMLKYLLKFILNNLAQPVSLTKTYNDLKSQGYTIAKNTVFEYISYLEEAFILFRADIWHRSVRAQALNPSKYYGIDPAFKYAMSIGDDTGRILENAVFLHLRRLGRTPHYFLEKQEVDFFWENGVPLNVCYDFSDHATREREIKGMLNALNALGLPKGYVLTRDKTEEFQLEGKHIIVQPAWTFLLHDSIDFT